MKMLYNEVKYHLASVYQDVKHFRPNIIRDSSLKIPKSLERTLWALFLISYLRRQNVQNATVIDSKSQCVIVE